MIKKIIFFITLTLISCSKSDNIIQEDIVIPLKKTHGTKPFGTRGNPLAKVNKPTDHNLVGLPKSDSIRIQYFNFKNYKQLDSISPKGIYAYAALEENQIVVVLDNNFNKDLSDDKKLYFERDFREKLKKSKSYRSAIPLANLYYDTYLKSEVIKDSIVYQLIPNDGSYFSKNDPLFNKLLLKMVTRDYFAGFFNITDTKYKVAYNPGGLFYPSFLFSKINDSFPTRAHYNYQEYKLKDTLQLGTSYFRIDSVTPAIDQLFLKKLGIKEKPIGFREGETIKDIRFKDIKFKSNSFSQLLENKEYLLVDFWGTWCAPCIKMTPDIVALNEDFSNKLTILSFAYDKERSKVSEHIKTHNMDWEHVFLEGNAKGRNHPPVINDLRIESYPTFLLLDKELNIKVRGSNPKALKKIREILTN